ncbi:MAG: NF038122 family metalloprotease [Caulobacteraceae bacterium]|nr:NF038122 family metalloprotease [Caulobacteraceae bacterium]
MSQFEDEAPWVSKRAAAMAILALAALSVGGPAGAITIHATFDSSITAMANASQIEAAFNTVAGRFDTALNDPSTINIDVSWGSVDGRTLPASALGGSIDNLYGYFSYGQVKGFLTAEARANPGDAVLAGAVAHLPAAAPGGLTRYVIPSAEAKSLGLFFVPQTALDGYIGFAGSAASYTFSSSGPVAANTYDFDGVAAHEIEEVLGRMSGIAGPSPGYRTVLDLFRYSAPGVMSDSYSAPAYFSLDGGATSLGAFNVSAKGGDRSDWATPDASGDIQDAFIPKGQRLTVSAADLTALDILGLGNGPGHGFQAAGFALPDGDLPLNSAAPEPWSWSLMLAGFAMAGARLRRRRPLRAN